VRSSSCERNLPPPPGLCAKRKGSPLRPTTPSGAAGQGLHQRTERLGMVSCRPWRRPATGGKRKRSGRSPQHTSLGGRPLSQQRAPGQVLFLNFAAEVCPNTYRFWHVRQSCSRRQESSWPGVDVSRGCVEQGACNWHSRELELLWSSLHDYARGLRSELQCRRSMVTPQYQQCRSY
jgi:hypothetical protein